MAAQYTASVSSAESVLQHVCTGCGRLREDGGHGDANVVEEVMSRCSDWLTESCSIHDGDSVFSADSSEVSSFSTTTGNTESQCEDRAVDGFVPDICQNVLTKKEVSNFGDVKVLNSKHVLIGNKTIINGPVYINSNSSTMHQQNTVNQITVDASVNKKPAGKPLRIIPRRDWLAQPPLLKTPLPEAVKYIVICHTATEEGFTNAENIHLIRLNQTYHIESRGWDDIAYNFMLGSDGIVYEGRGWGLQGAFAYGYNRKALGIGFVGCFMNHLPPAASLHAAKELIKHGVDLGHIPEDYTLVGHCQCSAVESPGRKLYEEVKTWPRWRELTPDDI